MFQSTAGPKTGCNDDRLFSLPGAKAVSIHSRPEDRLQLGAEMARSEEFGIAFLERMDE